MFRTTSGPPARPKRTDDMCRDHCAGLLGSRWPWIAGAGRRLDSRVLFPQAAPMGFFHRVVYTGYCRPPAFRFQTMRGLKHTRPQRTVTHGDALAPHDRSARKVFTLSGIPRVTCGEHAQSAVGLEKAEADLAFFSPWPMTHNAREDKYDPGATRL